MSGHRHPHSFSAVRMGVAERLALAALGSLLLWAGVFWAIE